MSVYVSVCVSACLSFACVHHKLKTIGSIDLKLEHIVLYEHHVVTLKFFSIT